MKKSFALLLVLLFVSFAVNASSYYVGEGVTDLRIIKNEEDSSCYVFYVQNNELKIIKENVLTSVIEKQEIFNENNIPIVCSSIITNEIEKGIVFFIGKDNEKIKLYAIVINENDKMDVFSKELQSENIVFEQKSVIYNYYDHTITLSFICNGQLCIFDMNLLKESNPVLTVLETTKSSIINYKIIRNRESYCGYYETSYNEIVLFEIKNQQIEELKAIKQEVKSECLIGESYNSKVYIILRNSQQTLVYKYENNNFEIINEEQNNKIYPMIWFEDTEFAKKYIEYTLENDCILGDETNTKITSDFELCCSLPNNEIVIIPNKVGNKLIKTDFIISETIILPISETSEYCGLVYNEHPVLVFVDKQYNMIKFIEIDENENITCIQEIPVEITEETKIESKSKGNTIQIKVGNNVFFVRNNVEYQILSAELFDNTYSINGKIYTCGFENDLLIIGESVNE